jgi:lipopolysaccharide export system protein LptA
MPREAILLHDPDRSIWRRAAMAALALATLAALPSAAVAQQTQRTMSGLNLSNDEPIQIESDRLEVRDNDKTAVFTGNVTVVQGPTLMRTGRMVVHYSGGVGQPGGASPAGAQSNNIERIEVDGKVYVKSETQVATADSGTFDLKTEILTLIGKEVVLTEGDNVIVGCKLTVLMQTGQATLDGCGGGAGQPGRVKMLLQPGSQPGQGAPAN